MDNYWLSEFSKRMQLFGSTKVNGFTPASIKIRAASGCFHREHSPEAYRLIDKHLGTTDFSTVHCRFEEHESGPEILVYLAVGAAGLGLAKSIVELTTAIIKARSEGIKRGDTRSDPLELIIRGHTKDGEFFEEKVLRIPPELIVTTTQIEDALAKRKLPINKKKRKAKSKS